MDQITSVKNLERGCLEFHFIMFGVQTAKILTDHIKPVSASFSNWIMARWGVERPGSLYWEGRRNRIGDVI